MTRIPKQLSSQTHSRHSLENCVGQIEQLLETARRVASEMDRLKIGEIVVANQPSLLCAIKDLSRWERACGDALTAKLNEIGYFRAEIGAAVVPQQIT